MPAYRALGEWYEVTLVPLANLSTDNVFAAAGMEPGHAAAVAPAAYAEALGQAVGSSSVLRSRIPDLGTLAVVQGNVAARPNHGARPGALSPMSSASTQTL